MTEEWIKLTVKEMVLRDVKLLSEFIEPQDDSFAAEERRNSEILNLLIKECERLNKKIGCS